MNPNNIFIVSVVGARRGPIEGTFTDECHEIILVALQNQSGKEVTKDRAAEEITKIIQEDYPERDGWVIRARVVRLAHNGIAIRHNLPRSEPEAPVVDATIAWMLLTLAPQEGAVQFLNLLKAFFEREGEEYSIRITAPPQGKGGDTIVRLVRDGTTSNVLIIEGK